MIGELNEGPYELIKSGPHPRRPIDTLRQTEHHHKTRARQTQLARTMRYLETDASVMDRSCNGHHDFVFGGGSSPSK